MVSSARILLAAVSLSWLLGDTLFACPALGTGGVGAAPPMPCLLRMALRGGGRGAAWKGNSEPSSSLDGDRTPPLMVSPVLSKKSRKVVQEDEDTEELLGPGAAAKEQQPWSCATPRMHPNFVQSKEFFGAGAAGKEHQPWSCATPQMPPNFEQHRGNLRPLRGATLLRNTPAESHHALTPAPIRYRAKGGGVEAFRASTMKMDMHAPAQGLDPDKVDKLEKVLADRSSDWSIRMRSLQDLRALVTDGNIDRSERADAIQRLLPGIRTQLEDKRSLLVKEACLAVSRSAEILGEDFETFVPKLVPVLLHLTYVTVKVISQSGSDCLLSLVSSVSPHDFPRTMPEQIVSSAVCKADTVRLCGHAQHAPAHL